MTPRIALGCLGCLLGAFSPSWADNRPDSFQTAQEAFPTFSLSTDLLPHTSLKLIQVYEAPHGSIYDGGDWGHQERFTVDALHLVRPDLSVLGARVLLDMYFHTFSQNAGPYADSFQINGAGICLVAPRWQGITASFEGASVSNSGQQEGRSTFQLIGKAVAGLPFDFLIERIATNDDPVLILNGTTLDVVSKLTQPDAIGKGLVWRGKKSWAAEAAFDATMFGVPLWAGARLITWLTDDPTQPLTLGLSTTRGEAFLGGSVPLASDTTVRFEAALIDIQGIWGLSGKGGVTLSK